MSDTTKTDATQRAAKCWELMDENERAVVRFGMTPAWTIRENLGGKCPGFCSLEAPGHGDEVRELAVALMNIAKNNGGMIV